MERFKVCEKEMKTKAFSKEGLGQAAKLDPREKARNDMRDWINETVDKLTAEVRRCACLDSRLAGVLPRHASQAFMRSLPAYNMLSTPWHLPVCGSMHASAWCVSMNSPGA